MKETTIMTKRERLEAKIEANKLKIVELQKVNMELIRETYLLSDKNQWYTEEKQMCKEGRSKVERLLGFINWKEDFVDEDTGNVITIERRQIIKVDGEWIR